MARFIDIGLVLITALFLFVSFPHTQHYWLLCSALLLTFLCIGKSFSEQLTGLFFTGVISAIGVLLAGVSSYHHFFLSLIYLSISTGLLQLLAQSYPQYRYSAILITLFIIIALNLPVFPAANFIRAQLIIYGTCIVMLGQFLLMYHYQQNVIRAGMKLSLQQLRWLSSEIFSCFIEEAYADNLYLFERRLHLQKMKVTQSLQRLATLTNAFPVKEPQIAEATLAQLTNIYHLLMAITQLRWRVIDLNTFKLCQNEMMAISQSIDQTFVALIAKLKKPSTSVETYPLAQAIIRFEENYQQVLNVAAQEPLVFLLFINDLKALNGELRDVFT